MTLPPDRNLQLHRVPDTQHTAMPLLRWPVDIRGTALTIIAFVAVVHLLQWAKQVFIPLVLAISLSYALTPFVNMLKKRLRLPPALGAALALLLLVSTVAYLGAALQPQMATLLDNVPQATKKLESLLHRTSLDRTSAFRKITIAADEFGKATNPDAARLSQQNSPGTNAIIGASPDKLREVLWNGAGAVLTGFGQTVVVLALSYFLLISGHSFKRRLVKISGDTLTEKKLTVQILDEIDTQIQRYIVIQVGTSALVGVLTGVAFWVIGVDSAFFWGVAAGVLHLVPYIGTALVILLSSVFAYLQFSELHTVLLVDGVTLAIAGLVGFGMVPWLTEKVGRINAVATFVALIAWEWLWGIPGLLLGIPIMMAVMAVCERIERLQPIAELLGSDK
ncbi:AI-2E family transporter [Hydrocarboniphaga sp.]|uniref:AI-2E family transporter n=1 Tax=Hydrocarboniphaga sp. TaxID=2033016 RepID=UPI003D113291